MLLVYNQLIILFKYNHNYYKVDYRYIVIKENRYIVI